MALLVLQVLFTIPALAQEAGDGEVVLSPWHGLIRLSEVVTDPQTDRDGGGAVTNIDEFVEIVSRHDQSLSIDGWRLEMVDSSPASLTLDGEVWPGGHRVLLNPPGDLNNDVHLKLIDAQDRLVDDVHLGAGDATARPGVSYPNGNAADPLDEAVVLDGAWEGAAAPVTPAAPLAALWAESVAVLPHTDYATDPQQAQDELDRRTAFDGAWYKERTVDLAFRLHAAPGSTALDDGNLTVQVLSWNGTTERAPLVIGRTEGPLLDAIATGVSMPEAPADHAAAARLHILNATGQTLVQAWPGTHRSDISVRADLLPPRAIEDHVVTDGHGNITWVPAVIDGESGIRRAALHADPGDGSADANGTTTALDCAIGTEPDVYPGLSCRLPDNHTTEQSLWMTIEDVAGHETVWPLTIRPDVDPPHHPNISFVPDARPQLRWDAFGEPLVDLRVSVAEDATGVWLVENVTLHKDAQELTDDSYAPGDTRAYRLVATDRGRHVSYGPWHAMPADAVPVQLRSVARADGGPLDEAALHLATAGEVRMSLGYDRVLAELPDVVLHLVEPRPLWLLGDATVAPDGQTVEVRFVRPDGFPLSGRGSWTSTGGRGEDGAPIDPLDIPTEHDAGPPVLHVDGAADSWLRTKRHALVVSATDATDPKPQIRLDERPKGVTMSGPSDEKRITVRGEGRWSLSGTATDDDGNTATFEIAVALDATAPHIEAEPLPERWRDDTPIELTVRDTTSGPGVTGDDLMAWVRLRDGRALEVPVERIDRVKTESTEQSTYHVRPPSGATDVEPVAVHVAAWDAAGNLAEGTLGDGFEAAVPGEPARLSANDRGGDSRWGSANGEAWNVQRPAPQGPSWVVEGPSALETAPGEANGSGHAGAAGTGGSEAAAWRTEGSEVTGDRARSRASTVDGAAKAGVWSLAGFGVLAGLGSVVRRRRRVGADRSTASGRTVRGRGQRGPRASHEEPRSLAREPMDVKRRKTGGGRRIRGGEMGRS